MKSAYLYARVSTDEQKRKGYSLPEQEDRLLKYCAHNDIQVKGIYHEDFSAKNFNRPEWKKLIAIIKKNSGNEHNILFIKWDRFSRNIEYAYEMIGILRKYHAVAMAIDQPVDFTVPESTVMLAVYLSIPEAENSRRALNTANGIRKAKQLGRYPNKAPLGYINLTELDGRKYIGHKQPEADIMKWAFQQLAKNCYKIDVVRKMACDKGLICSRSHFVRLVRNPVYCGLINPSSTSEEQQLIRGIHDPIISETLFYEVQDIINTKKNISSKKDKINETFFLKGSLICPNCGRLFRASISRGYSQKYPYYHCFGNCKSRVRADLLNSKYNESLRNLRLSNKVTELFRLILEDINVNTYKAACLQERKTLLKQIDNQELFLSKVRKMFVADKLEFDDFRQLKSEKQAISGTLEKELDTINMKLKHIDKQFNVADRKFVDIFHGFEELETADKKQVVSLIAPTCTDLKKGEISIEIDNALSKILVTKRVYKSIER